MIETRALVKVYPPPASKRSRRRGPGPASGGVRALDGLDLAIESGEFFGLLGPNGAGKTTAIGILTTRIRPTSGEAIVAGRSVTTEAVAVRRNIGVVPQRPNPDRSLTARENLAFHATYFGIARARAARLADELLERFGMAEKRDAKVDQLSGGQQQRLMIARALSHDPAVLFLDEPTVGLDPLGRLELWRILRELNAAGKTIVMTTHYMEEADQLCRRVGILDRGRLLALDAPARLKEQAPGGTLVELTLDGDASTLLDAARRLEGISRAESAGPLLRVYSDRGGRVVPAMIDLAEASGRTVRDIHLAVPSLETLFVGLTGRKLE